MTRLLPGRSLCRGCPVQTECAYYAIFHNIEYGVWGGLDSSEREALLRFFTDPLPE